MTAGAPGTRSQRRTKRKQHLAGRLERERVADLPESWLTPKGRMSLLGVFILLLAGAVAATVWRAEVYASGAADAQAFRHARACAPAPAAQTDCLLDIPASVDRAWSESTGRYSSAYYVALSGPAPARGTIQLADAYPLPTGPEAATVDALVWHGQRPFGRPGD